jgi:hypothetical protein
MPNLIAYLSTSRTPRPALVKTLRNNSQFLTNNRKFSAHCNFTMDFSYDEDVLDALLEEEFGKSALFSG